MLKNSIFLVTWILLIARTNGQEDCLSVHDIITNEVTEAAKFYFSENPNLDSSGFNVIGEDEFWDPADLFVQQYGESATSARFFAAILDFTFFESKNISYTDITQFVEVGEYQDARQGFAAFVTNMVAGSIEGECFDEDEGTKATLTIRSFFRSLYDIVGLEKFASFLNLQLGSSLSFVMDTTGSMSEEIAAAKDAVIDIIESTRDTSSAPLNYVLVPYNDPGYGPATKTGDPDLFISAVDNLFASGGGDEPELAMLGTLLATQNSGFRSIIYIFTDASAKNENLQNHVIAACLIKKISVYVFLTNDLGSDNDPYLNVVGKTGGLLMFVNKGDISEATEVMKSTTVQGLVVLQSVSETNNNSLTLNVDSAVGSLIVQFTGVFSFSRVEKGNVTITRNILTSISSVELFRLENVTSGIYTFYFDKSASNNFGVLIRGKSTLGFHSRLSQKKRGSDEYVASRQLQAHKSTLADITVYGDAENTKFEKLQLVSRNGDVLLEVDVEAHNDREYYVDDEFDLPEVPMFVKMTGVYMGAPIERIDPCAVTPTVTQTYLDDIKDVTLLAGSTIKVTTTLHNLGGDDSFFVYVSDNRNFVILDGSNSAVLSNETTQTITLLIAVPSTTQAGVLSKVLLTATATSGDYFVFTTFVVSVIDGVTRCPSPLSPSGGTLQCTPDARSVGSSCSLKCGAEYVREGTETISCQSDGTWDTDIGTCKLLGSQTCSLNGDPHYQTFDGIRYDFMGTCLYKLVESDPDSDVEPVSIATENTHLFGKTRVSYLKQAFVTVYNTTVHFKQGKIILIDGVRITLPALLFGGRLQIKLDGGDVLLTTDFKLQVRHDGQWFFRASLPASYMGKVSGLCSNYDGVGANEFQIGNSTFNLHDFGNHHEIVGGADPWCRKGQEGDEEDGCTSAAERAIYAEKCAAMKSDCFTDCEDEETLEQLFNNCVYDMCANDGNEKLVEEALADFAKTCAEKGNQKICDWRDRFGYPILCENNAHYELFANRCPNTCVSPLASTRCERLTKVEGCVCNDGFLRDGTDCIRASECGCTDSGRYYKKGEYFINSECTERCECTNGLLQCSPMNCRDGTVCALLPAGSYGCQIERVDQCYATGDPHYRTLDGSTYDFMGKCAYVMLHTTSETLEPGQRIKVIAQNENLNGNTRVSYLRSLTIEILDYKIELGQGQSVMIKRHFNGSYEEMPFTEVFIGTDELFTVEIEGAYAVVKTEQGIKIRFAGRRVYIDVPNYYMHKVEGLCGNYTGTMDDDFNGKDILDFAAEHLVRNGSCEEDPDREEFVCTDEDKAKWGAPEFCGKITDPKGPFQYCFDEVDVTQIFNDCVFDACATEGDLDVINQALLVYGEVCKGNDVDLPCTWETDLGINFDCPEHSQYDGCASKCLDTCQNPTAAATCADEETVGRCVCDLGYVLHEGKCVKETTCGCVFENGDYVEQGEFYMAEGCSRSEECTGSHAVSVIEEPCSEDTKCKVTQAGLYRCVPDELSYALFYGGRHIKTFDNKFFTFEGNCAYQFVGHLLQPGELPRVPMFYIYLTQSHTWSKEVVMKVGSSTETYTVKITSDKVVIVNDKKVAIGSYLEDKGLHTDKQLGNVVLDFDFGVHVHFNGKDWLRVDVEPHFEDKMVGMAGNFNGDPDDDLQMDDMMFTPTKWGDRWLAEEFSSDECTHTTPDAEMPCPFKSRYERSCDCGVISDESGPFAACHARMDPEPFMEACVKDACKHDGSTTALTKILRAYYIACIGKGIKIDGWRDDVKIEEPECPENSHYDDCAQLCQPRCGAERDCVAVLCQEGCQCDDGFILSNGACVPEDKCGCLTEDGHYFEHGACHTSADCAKKCTCLYGDWSCEETSCYENQFCGVLEGEYGCHWKDLCKYDHGGCSDACSWNNGSIHCTCNPGRILTKDDRTCVDMSTMFFSECTDTCDATFNVWKMEFNAWKNNYLPEWMEEFEEYREYVRTDILSSGLVCKYSWTEWFDRDDPGGCGDEETLEYLKLDYPGKICDKPIAAEGRMADGRKIGTVLANFEVDEYGLTCKNSDQPKGVECPDFGVRFLCPDAMEKPGCT